MEPIADGREGMDEAPSHLSRILRLMEIQGTNVTPMTI